LWRVENTGLFRKASSVRFEIFADSRQALKTAKPNDADASAGTETVEGPPGQRDAVVSAEPIPCPFPEGFTVQRIGPLVETIGLA
jgi:hypothetical protein